MSDRPIIALLTDFGTADWFVGSMKGVILARAPECAIVDLCHSIEPGEVAQAAWLLERTFRDFPPATVFCAVVDPGVGSERRAIAAAADDYFFVAPDNGLLSGVWRGAQSWQCRAITNKRWMRPSVSQTFHGRDIFAPAAAQIARERRIENAGDCVADPVEIELPSTAVAPDGSVEGTIVYFDRFGNAITSIAREKVETVEPGKMWQAEVGRLTVERLSSTYADVAPGEPVAYWGSLATLEIAVRGRNARERLALRLGERVWLRQRQRNDE